MSSDKITKIDLVESIHDSTGYDKKAVQEIVDSLFFNIKKSLENGSTIELRGFGTFEPRLRKGRAVAHNPKTGEILSVAPHYVVAFRSGQELKKSLWDLKK